MSKTLAETLKLLLNNQKLLSDQVAVLNEKIKVLQQLHGQKVIKAHAVKKSHIMVDTKNEKVTVH